MRFSLHAHAMLIGLLGTVFLVGCAHDPQPTPSTLREIQEVRHQTVPNSGQLIRATEPVQNSFSIRAEWAIQTGSPDNQIYFRWLKDKLGSEYRVTAETASTITFAKRMDGDSYDLEVSVGPTPSGVVAEVKFIVLPD